jgi:hypothetical protein
MTSDQQFMHVLLIYTLFQVLGIIVSFLGIIICIIALASSSQFAHDFTNITIHFSGDIGKLTIIFSECIVTVVCMGTKNMHIQQKNRIITIFVWEKHENIDEGLRRMQYL